MRKFSLQQMFFHALLSFLKIQWNSKGWKRSIVLLSFIQGGGRDLSWDSAPRPQKCQISRLSGCQNWGSWSQVTTAPQLLSTVSSLALGLLQLSKSDIKNLNGAFLYQREFQAENEILALFTSERPSHWLQGGLDFTWEWWFVSFHNAKWHVLKGK